jgi:hypothetical protein
MELNLEKWGPSQDAEYEKRILELTKFETTNQIIRKQNHLTGVIE